MSTRNKIGFALTIISLVMLYPGLFDPMITIKAGMNTMLGRIEVMNETRSIVGTMEHLFNTGNAFVACLILLFSIVVPLIKAVILLYVLLIAEAKRRYPLYKFVHAIGKWSMADVFAIGVLIAYLAGQATKNMDAELHSGFYYFTAYCLVSLTGITVIKIFKTEEAHEQPTS